MILLVRLLFSTDAFSQTPTVRITPIFINSPGVGGEFSVDVMIENGRRVAGYQLALSFDSDALTYVKSTPGNYLPRSGKNFFFDDSNYISSRISISSASAGGTAGLQEVDGNGTLATLTFRVKKVQASRLTLILGDTPRSGTLLSNKIGSVSKPIVVSGEVRVTTPDLKIPEQDEIISNVAFGPNSTYFVLTAKFPEVTRFPADVYYGDCTITLYPRENTQIFVLPIESPEQQNRGAYTAAKFGLAVAEEALDKISIFGPAMDIAETITAFANYLQALEERRNPLVQIKLSPRERKAFPINTQRYPPDILQFVVILKSQESVSRSNLAFVIEQKYQKGNTGSEYTAKVSDNWNLSSAAPAAPAGQPMLLAGYPAFQLLPPEVQEYLLLHFGAFATPEVWQTPEVTSLSPNYPNPFNPETWIPYQLAKPSDVEITIYDARGRSIRHLQLGHQPAGIYASRSRAAYWNGKNEIGEAVASGLYFYTLSAGNFTATRKMLVRK